jgi:hypothetical protein
MSPISKLVVNIFLYFSNNQRVEKFLSEVPVLGQPKISRMEVEVAA